MSSNHGVVYLGPGKVEIQSIDYPELKTPQGKKVDHGVVIEPITTNIGIALLPTPVASGDLKPFGGNTVLIFGTRGDDSVTDFVADPGRLHVVVADLGKRVPYLSATGKTNYGIPQIRLFDFDASALGDAGTLMGIPQAGTTPGKLAENTFAFRDTVS